MVTKLEKMYMTQSLSLSKTSLGVKHGKRMSNIFCLSITLIWNSEVQFPETIQIFQIPKIGITGPSDGL